MKKASIFQVTVTCSYPYRHILVKELWTSRGLVKELPLVFYKDIPLLIRRQRHYPGVEN